MALDQVDVDKDIEYEVKRTDEMSFWQHLDELRRRLMRIFLALAIGIVVVFVLGEKVFTYIIFAPLKPDFVTYKFMCNLAQSTGMQGLCIKAPQLELFSTELGEVFFKQMQIAFVLGLMGASPYVFWQIWLFIKPGLMKAEARAARGFVLICSSLFVAGVMFGFFVITPFAVSFLANYTMAGVGGKATLGSYVGYLVMFTLPIGLVFELPVVIYFLSKMGIVTPQFLKNYRRHMIVVLLILAGIITPSPDLISQLLVFVPLYILYEIGIGVSARVEKKRASAKID
jgi:sec-independent protein translocase protein TatC